MTGGEQRSDRREELSEQLTDAVEDVLAAHHFLDRDSRCACGAVNNMDGDVLDSHRISLIADAIDIILFSYDIVRRPPHHG